MKSCLKLLLAFALLVSASASAQVQQERAASGNNSTVSASSRVDAINKRLNIFINTQSANFTGQATNIIATNANFIGQIGLLTSTLANVGTTGACTPGTGMHGCKPQCACSVNGKILWNGSKWQCFQAQYQCPQGQSYDSATCKCKTTTGSCTPQTPPQTCEPGKVWDPRTCTCCSNCNTGECPTGMSPIDAATATACGLSRPCICNDYEVVTRNGITRAMIHPDLRPYVNLDNENGCEVVKSCKYGMDRSGRSCCCPTNQRLVNNSCGDVCPAGSQPSWIGHANTILGGCFEYAEPTGNTCPSGFTMNGDECRKSVPTTVYGSTPNASRCVP